MISSALKPRSAWLLYVVLLATGSLFVFPWVVLMMRDLNQIEQRAIFPVRILTWVFGVGFGIYFSVLLYLFLSNPPKSFLVFAVGWLVGFTLAITLMVFLIRVSKQINRSLGLRIPFGHSAMIVLLTFAYVLSFPLTQLRLNRLITARTPASIHLS